MLRLFLALALPMLILDYQSWLGRNSGSWRQVAVGPTLRQLVAMIRRPTSPSTAGLGLTPFLLEYGIT